MKPRANTYVIRMNAQRFSAAAQEIQVKGQRIHQSTDTLVNGTNGWKGEGAEAYESLAQHMNEDTRTAGSAFASIAQSLNQLAGQLDTVNSLRDQADHLQMQIQGLARDFREVEPQNQALMQQELSHLRHRHSMIEMQADTIERQADSAASAQFDEIAQISNRLHFAQGIPEKDKPWAAAPSEEKKDDPIFSWTDLLQPGVVVALVLSKSIKFTKSSNNRNVFNVSTAAWLRGQSRSQKWNWCVRNLNRLFVKIPKLGVSSTARAMKDWVLGVDQNLTRISGSKLPMHMVKRVVGPLSILLSVKDEIEPVTDSWKTNSAKEQSREEFWKNFTADCASSLNRIVLSTAGSVAGTAVGGFVGSFVGPEGTIIAGSLGGGLGGSFGKWVAKKTDAWARKVGENVGIGIAKGLDYVDKLKRSIGSYNSSLSKDLLPLT